MTLSNTEDRLFFGYRLRTELALNALPALPPGDAADIELSLGEAPLALAAPVSSNPFVEIDEDGTVLVRIGERLRFVVRHGRQVVLDNTSNALAREIEPFLFGIVAGVLLHQKGVLALHASSVIIDGVAVAMCGPSGRGKSTLAAALSAAGHGLVTDDICRIGFSGDDALAFSGPSRLRLWPDAVRALGRSPESLEPGRPGHPKAVLIEPRQETGPMPLGAIIRLNVDSRIDAPRIERLAGPSAVMPAEEIIYRIRLSRLLGRRIGVFQDLTRLAAMVPVFRLVRPEGRTDLAELIQLVRSVVRPRK